MPRVGCSPKGPKLGFEYLPAYKTLHCVRTACTAFPFRAALYLHSMQDSSAKS